MRKESISIRRFFQAVGFKVDCGFEYLWGCYGPNAAGIGWDKEDLSASAGIVYDTKTHVVYEMSVWDEKNNLVLLWVDPRFKKAKNSGYKERGLNHRIAFDKVKFTEATPGRCFSLLSNLKKRRKSDRRVNS